MAVEIVEAGELNGSQIAALFQGLLQNSPHQQPAEELAQQFQITYIPTMPCIFRHRISPAQFSL
jgi:hypothetical protein